MLKKMTILVGVALLCAPYAFADHHEGGDMPPEGDMPHLMLAPPPETEKPEDVGEPPPPGEDPEALVDWLTPIFHGMMDTDDSGEVSLEELRAWAVFAHVPPPEGDEPPPPPPEGDEPPPPPEGDEPPPPPEGDEPPPPPEGDEPPPPE